MGRFSIGNTSLFLAIMARLAGMKAGTVTIQATNAHIYHDHFEQVREQLKREHFAPPSLVIADTVRAVGLDEVDGVFTRIEPTDISLVDYLSHAPIKAPMAV